MSFKRTGWFVTAIAALFISASANAETIVYQDTYDEDGIDTNVGIGGGAVSINTSPISWAWAIGGWIDDGNLKYQRNGGSGGISGGSYSLSAFDFSGGFTLEVTYNAVNSQDRFSMGLMKEVAAEDRTAYAAICTSGATTNNGIYFNAFAYDSRGRYPNASGLQWAAVGDANAVVQLSDEQSRETGVHALVLEMDTESNWSYSIDGNTPTTGQIDGDGFDLSKNYRFVTYSQGSGLNMIQSVTLTSHADNVLPGDADGDGDVDAADYIMVKTHFGGAPAAGTEGSGGDFNGNGTVDWNDLQELMSGLSSGTGGAPIPEPATLIILAVGLPALLKRRRRS